MSGPISPKHPSPQPSPGHELDSTTGPQVPTRPPSQSPSRPNVVEPHTLEGLDERAADAIELLEAIVADRGLLAHLAEPTRVRLLTAAGRVARPDARARRRLARVGRLKERRDRRDADERLLASTGIRVERSKSVFQTPLPPARDHTAGHTAGDAPRGGETLLEPRTCYVCKAEFRELHFFYDSMCPPCARLNWEKRNQSADLSGRTALITGARVKIGYQAAIMLLRAGAQVVVTTRFPRDAAARYAREPDFDAWRHRLSIYGLDLRHTPSVDTLARYLPERLDRLDFIINNACQTVRRPAGFYAHLMAAESSPLTDLPGDLRPLVADYEDLRHAGLPGFRPGTTGEPRAALVDGARPEDAYAAGIHHAAELSQIALLREDLERSEALFPTGALDADLQQVDLRHRNSWRLTLAEVSPVELLEVHLINAIGPFVLNSRLKPLMLRHPGADKHIVNVSAMEGQFYRSFKTDRHPHTNMAKAALNMMTRTSAADYVKDGIHMNSVDTGWVTDEDPADLARRKTADHGFHPPLDIVDGAARICDPIFAGIATGQHVWGKFLKDYRPTDW